MSSNPVEVSLSLANVYGHKLDEPIMYTQGVALSGRIRLEQLVGRSSNTTNDLRNLTLSLLEPRHSFTAETGTANLAGIIWANELAEVSGDNRYAELLVRTGDRFKDRRSDGMPTLLDPDLRVEDMFFASALLGRATKITGISSYVDIAAEFLTRSSEKLLQDNGLYWHCLSSRFFWGRGNGFAALGFAELMSYLPVEHPARSTLMDAFNRHLTGLEKKQDRSGMWRQVINRPDSYLEMSATCMIGYSIARGLRLGWLGNDFKKTVDDAWRAVANRIDDAGNLEKVCVGTGPLISVEDYVKRPFVTGYDDRGGSMALWFAVEMARLG